MYIFCCTYVTITFDLTSSAILLFVSIKVCDLLHPLDIYAYMHILYT